MANNFWSSVKKLIKQQNMTQRGLSASIGLSERTIEQWILRDCIPAADIAVKIADKLNVSVESLLQAKRPNRKSSLKNGRKNKPNSSKHGIFFRSFSNNFNFLKYDFILHKIT